ncbi:hypothetical protein H0H87_001462 [Tephrocybe sp. NHM501043]|nr:hypothetical protein H0H87_001462 [Tephrocybe sp. NHM501043]
MAPSRKRKRVEVTPEQEEEQDISNEIQHSKKDLSHDPEKEQEVWESFKDEHFEAIDQLPLALHRHYDLNSELDQRANASLDLLLATILEYIDKRRDLMLAREARGASETKIDVEDQSLQSNGRDTSQMMPALSSLPPTLSKRATTGRQMLTKAACLSDEILRASEEKVNVAQAAYESVDRLVRKVQQAIKDQEASINLGARPGHLQPGSLEDLAVSRWRKPTRATLSPINGDDLDEDMEGAQEAMTADDPLEDFTGLQISKARKGRGRAKGSRQTTVDVDVLSTPPLTITLPAQLPPAPDEEVFCTCKKAFYGEVRPAVPELYSPYPPTNKCPDDCL